MIEKLNKLTSWQVASIIILVALLVYSTGFANPFQGDDFLQIVNNVPVHSITNIKTFFDGGTFYDSSTNKLVSTYFRPMMTITFSLIYTIFGPHAIYFHILQFLLFTSGALLLYLVFRYSFKPALALILVLVFLVNPMNSEEVFAIPVMQDTLYFFFGILGVYLLCRFSSIKSLLFPVLCFILALLSKETGGLFLIIDLLFLFWWDRKRLYPFVAMVAPILIVYLLLRHHAVGTYANPGTAPIDLANLKVRLLTMPSIFLFYITKFLFPWRLSINYFWVDKSFTVTGVLVPLAIDLLIITAMVLVGLRIKHRASKATFYTYSFFGLWFAIGMLLNLQLVLLDCTACEPWFIFSMAGLLGMIGVASQTVRLKLNTDWLLLIALIILIALGFRTAMRGLDWRNQYKLSAIDLKASPGNHLALDLLAQQAMHNKHYLLGEKYEYQALDEFKNSQSYNTLGLIEGDQGNNKLAIQDFIWELNHGERNVSATYNNISNQLLDYGTLASDQAFYGRALAKFPRDATLWTNLAILEKEHDQPSEAKYALVRATQLGNVPNAIVQSIENNTLIHIYLPADKSITL
jgi:tetratricopeptide (TPR) repeat protein